MGHCTKLDLSQCNLVWLWMHDVHIDVSQCRYVLLLLLFFFFYLCIHYVAVGGLKSVTWLVSVETWYWTVLWFLLPEAASNVTHHVWLKQLPPLPTECTQLVNLHQQATLECLNVSTVPHILYMQTCTQTNIQTHSKSSPRLQIQTCTDVQ